MSAALIHDHSAMPRPSFLAAALSIWAAVLLIAPAFVAAHMVEVAAGKKECFFEDLHVNDKVRLVLACTAASPHLIRPDDRDISSRWWWAPRH